MGSAPTQKGTNVAHLLKIADHPIFEIFHYGPEFRKNDLLRGRPAMARVFPLENYETNLKINFGFDSR